MFEKGLSHTDKGEILLLVIMMAVLSEKFMHVPDNSIYDKFRFW